MKIKDFEEILAKAALLLTADARATRKYDTSEPFERRVREVIDGLVRPFAFKVDHEPGRQAFPDVVIGEFGIEVKVTRSDSWRTVANSINEGTRSRAVKHIYLLYGKMGGTPEVRWGRYEECVMHVRTSHSLRFEVEIGAKESLFSKFGVSYLDFARMSPEQKMTHIRKYVRGRLKEGERLWWLGDDAEQDHSVEPQVRLWMGLPQEEKRKLRAEAALLSPSIVKPARQKKKYDDVALYLLTYHGVLALQARDLFSAGSVALRSNSKRGGNYILRSLQDIEAEMLEAAAYLEDALFEEYWGVRCPPNKRIKEWLVRADKLAQGWKPSAELFKDVPKK